MNHTGQLLKVVGALVVFKEREGAAEVMCVQNGGYVMEVVALTAEEPRNNYERRFLVLTERGLGWIAAVGKRFTERQHT
jgi:hypothetical protein